MRYYPDNFITIYYITIMSWNSQYDSKRVYVRGLAF